MRAFRIQNLNLLRQKSLLHNSSLASVVSLDQGRVWESIDRIRVPNLQEIIQKCARERRIQEGKACHAHIIQLGWQAENITANMLVNLYAKSGNLDNARKLFDEMPHRDIVSWNTMIGAYTRNGYEEEAFIFLKEMHRDGTSRFTEFTVSGVLCACAAKLALIECRQLHCFAVKVSLESNMYVGTGLVDVYAKCSFIEDATRVFESMTERNAVTWTSMVVGFVKNELYEEALSLVRRAQRGSLEYNQFTVSSALSAAAALTALIEGNQMHAVVWKHNFTDNVYVASTLIDLYSKCGMVEDAYTVFSSAEEKNTVLWNATISGFARHGRSLQAMILFEKMQLAGFSPNEVTYISVLSACCHMGLVEEGRRYFDRITSEHNISQNVFHYSIMVDILGRSGRVEEAKSLIEEMPFEATPSMWGSLLASCKVHGNVELAELAAEHLFKMEPENAGNHVLLSNAYALKKRWEDVAWARKRLKESNVKKEKGMSWIEVKDKVHTFMVRERHHPMIEEVYQRLDDFVEEMRKKGYEGANEHEFHDVDESRKQDSLKHHSEKLAFIFGLMCLSSGVPIRIMKNLRICGDCHSFMKMASGFSRREIIVRDNNRFHCFRNGSCSCGDFWKSEKRSTERKWRPPKNYCKFQRKTQNAFIGSPSRRLSANQSQTAPIIFESYALPHIRVDRVEPGLVTCTFRVPARLIDRNGNFAAGAVANLVDIMGGVLVYEEGRPVSVSVDMSISYVSTAKLDDELEISSKLLGRKGGCSGTAIVLKNKLTGELIAEGRHSLFGKPDSKM